MPPAAAASRLRRVAGNPYVWTLLICGAIALGQAVWIWNHRVLGIYDPDEAGYIATAMRFHRSLSVSDPMSFVREVITTPTGITVPLLSVPFLIVGPRDPRTAMLVQPALLVFSALAITGIARRVVHPALAVVAAILYCGIGWSITGTQSFWYGLGAAAASLGALWALASSDRGRNRWLIGYSVGIGAMLMARTMTLGYLPALALAGAIVAGWDQRRMLRVGVAWLGGLAIAAPMYLVNREAIFGYLFSYGYGKRSGLFGEGGPAQRAWARTDKVLESVRFVVRPVVNSPITWVMVAIALVLATVTIRRRAPRSAGGRRLGALPQHVRQRVRNIGAGRIVSTDPGRTVAMLGVFLVASIAALSSTTNAGVWFEQPIIAVVPILGAFIVSKFPTPLRQWTAGVSVYAVAVQLAVGWWLISPTDAIDDYGVVPDIFAAHYEYGAEQYDPRFGPDHRDEYRAAAAEWWSLTNDVYQSVTRLQGGTERFYSVNVSGNFFLFNSNTLALAGEINSKPTRWVVPETVLPEDERAASLTPDDGRRPRLLVISIGNQQLFTPDAEVSAYFAQAKRLSWEVVRTFTGPDGGHVYVMRHPDSRTVTGSSGPG